MLSKCTMANSSATWQQAAHTTYQLSSPSCSTRAIQKKPNPYQNMFKSFLEKKLGEWIISRKMTRQKEQEDQAEKTREETGKGNQMTALRFQTGERHQSSPASLWGKAIRHVILFIKYQTKLKPDWIIYQAKPQNSLFFPVTL